MSNPSAFILYGDILIGLHNDVNKYKKDVLSQKNLTENTLKKINLLLIEARETISSTDDTWDKIIDWSDNFKNEKSKFKKDLKTQESFFISVARTTELKQVEIENSIREFEKYFNKKIELLQNIEANFNTQFERINLVQVEQERITKVHAELILVNENLKKGLIIQGTDTKTISNKLNTHLNILYIVCFILILTTIFLFNK